MSRLQNLLNQRLQKSEHSSDKMSLMAQKSANGNLTSFSGIFSVSDLNEGEKKFLEKLLEDHKPEEVLQDHQDLSLDLRDLISITSEVKAISNQAAILHGERIKRAHTILIRYKEGAFSSWLLATYGNRQTPYNLMQYYEFYTAMPQNLRPQIESMPRQAIYTLASRHGDLEKKVSIVEAYTGQSKEELLSLIRETFPLKESDKRAHNFSETLLHELRNLLKTTKNKRISPLFKKEILCCINEFVKLLES